MAKRYMGEGDPVLDALYEELDAIKGNTEAESLRRIELKDQIRAIREQRGLFGLRGGIKSLFGGLFDDLGQGLLRQHISQPQLDQFADETVANIEAEAAGEGIPFETPAQDVLGFGRRRIKVPSTVAEVVPEVVPELEEVEVTAEKRPEMIEAEPRRGKVDLRPHFPHGIYTGEFKDVFGNPPVPLEKLGTNQLKTLEKRKRDVARWPDAFPEDYATPESVYYGYAKGKQVKKSKKSKAIGEEGWLFDPSDPVDVGLMSLSAIPIPGGRAAAGAGLAGKAGIKGLLKLLRKYKNPKDWQVLDAGKFSNVAGTSATRSTGRMSLREQDKLFELRRAIDSMNRPGRSPYSKPLSKFKQLDPEMQHIVKAISFAGAPAAPVMLNEIIGRPIYNRRQKKKDIERWMAENEDDRTRDLDISILDLPEEYKHKALSDLGLRRAAEEKMVEDRELLELLALSSVDVDGMSPEIQALIEAEQAGGYAHGGILSGQADTLARAGRGDDTMLMHVTPEEVQGLASLAPGMMTINPETGLPEAGWFRNLLGFAAPFLMSMIPGVGPVLAGAMGGGLGSLIKGGDFKDALLGAGMGALGGKMFGGASEVGADVLAGEAATGAMATPEAFGQAMQGVGTEGLTDIATQAGIAPNLLSSSGQMPTGTITSAIQSGVNPSIAFSQAGVNPEQLGLFKEGLSGVAREALPDTFAQNFRNIGAGGLSGLKSAAFTPAGISYIGGTGLIAQHEGQQAFEDYLVAMEEQRKQRARDIEAYYPENFPIDAFAASGGAVGGYAGGGSIYKNRYINGNWS